MKISTDKIAASDRYLNVGITMTTGQAVRFGLVKIPLAWLLHGEIREALDREYRRQMLARWSGCEDDPLLFD